MDKNKIQELASKLEKRLEKYGVKAYSGIYYDPYSEDEKYHLQAYARRPLVGIGRESGYVNRLVQAHFTELPTAEEMMALEQRCIEEFE